MHQHYQQPETLVCFYGARTTQFLLGLTFRSFGDNNESGDIANNLKETNYCIEVVDLVIDFCASVNCCFKTGKAKTHHGEV